MAKFCATCGKKISLTSSKFILADGVIEIDCAKKIVDKPQRMAAYDIFRPMTVEEAKKAIQSGETIKIEDYKQEKKEQNKENKEKIKQLFSEFKTGDYLDFDKSVVNLDKKQFIFKMRDNKYSVKNFSDLVGYEVDHQESSSTTTKKKHGITRGIVGGTLAGPVGGIVGAGTAKSKSATTTNDNGDMIYLMFADGETQKIDATMPIHMSFLVEKSKKLQLTLANIIKQNEEKKASNSEQSSELDDLRKLKELLDDGIITQEDFDSKKAQILGL